MFFFANRLQTRKNSYLCTRKNQGKKIKHEAYYHGFNNDRNDRKHIIDMCIMRHSLWLLNRKIKMTLYFKPF